MIKLAVRDDLISGLDLLETQFIEHSMPYEARELEAALSQLLSREDLGLLLLAGEEV